MALCAERPETEFGSPVSPSPDALNNAGRMAAPPGVPSPEEAVRGVLRDMVDYLPVKLLPGMTGLIVILVLIRFLGPVSYGQYSLVVTTALLLGQIGGGWLGQAVLYAYPAYGPDRRGAFQRDAFKLQALLLSGAGVLSLGVFFLVVRRPTLIILGLGVLTLQLFHSLFLSFLQSTRQVAEQARSVAFQCVSHLLFVLILILWARGGEAFALAALLLGYGTGVAYLLFRGERNGLHPVSLWHRSDPALLRQLLAYGAPMCLWFFASQFFTVGDRLLLKFLRSTADVGHYASFRDLSVGLAGFATMPLLLASHPIIMGLWKGGRERKDVEEIIEQNLVFLILVFLPILWLVDLCGPAFLHLLFGRSYRLPTGVMVLVFLSVLLSAIMMYAHKGLEVTGQTKVMAGIATTVALLSVVGNLLLTRRFGIFGAATIVVVCQFVYIIWVRLKTSAILAFRVRGRFLLRLAVWTAAVEGLGRGAGFFFPDADQDPIRQAVRLAVVLSATGLLFSLSRDGAVLRRVALDVSLQLRGTRPKVR